MARIARDHPGIHLLLAGQGPMKDDVEATAGELGLVDRVHFLGNLSDVRPVLAASDFSIISSVAVETFSFAMLESMSMSTPVISSRIGGADEAVLPGRTGILVASGQVDELAGAMAELAADREATKKLGGNARQLVEEKFDRRDMIAHTAELVTGAGSAHGEHGRQPRSEES